MSEFKLDFDDVNAQALRITRKLAPLLADEHPTHTMAALTLTLASYITILALEVGAGTAEVDDIVDGVAVKMRRATHYQRAHCTRFPAPGHA